MPAHSKTKQNKSQKQAIKRLRKQCHTLSKEIQDKDITHKKLVELLGTACKYCNNLENHLKTKGYSRQNIEEIKESAIKYEQN